MGTRHDPAWLDRHEDGEHREQLFVLIVDHCNPSHANMAEHIREWVSQMYEVNRVAVLVSGDNGSTKLNDGTEELFDVLPERKGKQ